MTTTTTSTSSREDDVALSSAARLHPDWCDFEGPCTDEDVNPNRVTHYGRRTIFYPVFEDRRVGLVLVHGEDRVTGDPVDHGGPWITLTFGGLADKPDIDVGLSAVDARFLARQLSEYADHLERTPLWMTREHLGMNAVDYVVDIGILTQHPDGTMSLTHRPDEDVPGYCACGTLISVCSAQREAGQ